MSSSLTLKKREEVLYNLSKIPIEHRHEEKYKIAIRHFTATLVQESGITYAKVFYYNLVGYILVLEYIFVLGYIFVGLISELKLTDQRL